MNDIDWNDKANWGPRWEKPPHDTETYKTWKTPGRIEKSFMSTQPTHPYVKFVTPDDLCQDIQVQMPVTITIMKEDPKYCTGCQFQHSYDEADVCTLFSQDVESCWAGPFDYHWEKPYDEHVRCPSIYKRCQGCLDYFDNKTKGGE